MPNSETHFVAASVAGIGTYILKRNQRQEIIDPIELLAIGFFSGMCGILPDFIDPPNNPSHRSIGHSAVLSGSMVPMLWNKIEMNIAWSTMQKDMLHCMLVGYASHLLLDAGTKAGLPMLD